MKYLITLVVLLLLFSSCEQPGPAGANGLDGPQGSTGPAGQQGANGVQGVPGVPGTLVSPNIFCPSLAGSFPEAYLQIGTTIIAQYYDGQGRSQLAILVPGSYVTTDGRNCTFTIDSNYNILY